MSRNIFKTLRWLLLLAAVTMMILSNSQYLQAKSASAEPKETPAGNNGNNTGITQPSEPSGTEPSSAAPSGTEPSNTAPAGTEPSNTALSSIEPTAPTSPEPSETIPVEPKPSETGHVVQIPQKDLTLDQINAILKGYGKMTTPGMKFDVYKQAMNRPWIDAKDYENTPEKVTIDLNEKIDNEKYYELLKKLSRYDGVYLFEIGKTTNGQPIYSISIDFESDETKEVYMFTGQVHAREFGGGVFILKMFADLIQKAQTDASVQNLLKRVKYVAVPIINLDARQKIIDADPYYAGDPNNLWKLAVNGVDINRNFPGINAGLLANGYTPANATSRLIKAKGPYFGSNSETQAMIKWLYHYVINEKAVYLADMHQQGRVMYSGKPWDTAAGETRCKSTALNVMAYMNRGNKEKYYFIPESLNYGLRGEGSSITDYTMSLAFGAKYSEAFGINVFLDAKGNEYTLLQIRDMEKSPVELKKANPKFVAATYEIGFGNVAVGYTSSARRLLSQEYTKYHFDSMLEDLPGLVQ
ncbi:MAG: M14 family zinc carboxypeptidase [Eubacteriales bacterium]|nr:M14 family zinc carboxypeptidase [Eubacteriales bacterium]